MTRPSTGADGTTDDGPLLALARDAFGPRPTNLAGVAVSGGGDSMALLDLLSRVQRDLGGTVRAVTVDHGLRPGSADEARWVARHCAQRGIAHDTVVWRPGEVRGNVSQQARRARYALIADWARGNGVAHVAVGHTADDRAETFLMELSREAGIDGLTAMRSSWHAEGIHWARPLLSVGRATLRAYLRRQGIGWIDDPTNEDARFQRVRARRALIALAPLGITAGGLARVAGHLAAARAELVSHAVRAADEIATEDAGGIAFDRAGWRDLGPETARRLVRGALRWLNSAEHAPRGPEIARLERAIAEGRDATLAGCHLRVTGTSLCFTREPRAVSGAETPTDTLWDRRWRIDGPHESGLKVRALGAGGLRRCADWRTTGHSRAALVVTPAIWQGETLVAAPLAGICGDWRAEIVADFRSFLLSH